MLFINIFYEFVYLKIILATPITKYFVVFHLWFSHHASQELCLLGGRPKRISFKHRLTIALYESRRKIDAVDFTRSPSNLLLSLIYECRGSQRVILMFHEAQLLKSMTSLISRSNKLDWNIFDSLRFLRFFFCNLVVIKLRFPICL